MKTRIALLLAGSLLAMSTAASAGIKAGSFSVSPIIGGYTFDGVQHLDTNLVFGARAGYNFTKHFGVEALFDYVNPTDSTRSSVKDVAMYRYGGELLYHLMPDNNFVPYVAAGFSGLNFDKIDKKTRGAADYGIGAKYFINDNFALRGDVRHIIYSINDKSMNNVEYTIGAYIPFGGAEPAMKAVEPAPVAAPVVEPPPAPAPPPPAAPKAELSVAPASITRGESAQLNWTSENASKCEIQPAIGPVQSQGSMSITPADNTSYTLTCSGTGGVATSAAGIAVVKPAPVAIPALCNPTVINIQFDTNKSDIKPRYHGELKKLADFLKEFPTARGVIEGHTDSVGSRPSNMKLSQRRAESVRSYLIKTFGISAGRLEAKGYGPTKPVADNKTKVGKQKNRRIEANFVCAEK
jgi:OOP family OmpA-OmpF porin